MMSAHKQMRPVGLALLIMVLLFACCASALAAESDPVHFTIQVSPQSLTEPGKVTVSLKVANAGSEDMVDPVTLYDPAGNVVPSFGDGGSYVLKSGDSRSWEGEWSVTQAQLDAGDISYTLKYHLEDEAGELVEISRQATAAIEFTGEKANLTVSRSISPEVVRSGGQASVVYELYNSGNVALTDIRVKENISKNAQTVKTLAVGARTTLTFTSRMGNADLTSNANITYRVKGDSRTHTEKVEDKVIPQAKPNLKFEVTSPTAGVNMNEAATLVLTFTNSGNVAYSNVTVKDEKKGEILTNVSIPAGATVTESKEFILLEPTTFKLSAILPDNTGETNTLKAKDLTIGVFDPEKTILLTLNLTADQDTIHEIPADVRFHLTVTNNSNIKAEKISISHGGTHIYTISSLEPGASTVLTRDVRLSQAGRFRFTASVKDTMQNTVTFESNTLQIAYAQLTPVPTQVPVVTIAPPVQVTVAPDDPLLSQARSALMTAGTAIGILFAAALVLFLISTVVRLAKKSKSNAAYDHLELAERRDYTEPADEELEDVDARVSGEYKAPEELPHEKLVKSLQTEDAPAVEDMPDTDGEGGYRVTRTPKEDAPKEDKPAQEKEAPLVTQAAPVQAEFKEEESGEESAPRRRRSHRSQRTEDGE